VGALLLIVGRTVAFVWGSSAVLGVLGDVLTALGAALVAIGVALGVLAWLGAGLRRMGEALPRAVGLLATGGLALVVDLEPIPIPRRLHVALRALASGGLSLFEDDDERPMVDAELR